MDFNPDRFEGSEDKITLVHDVVFGFGRRRCPGSDFALANSFAVISTILTTCNILPALDHNGQELLPKLLFKQEAALCVNILSSASNFD